MNLASGLINWYSVNVVDMSHAKNILANVFKQELVSWPWEPNTNGRLALYLVSRLKRQSLIHKAEDQLDIICDNFDCPLFVARDLENFRKEIQFLPLKNCLVEKSTVNTRIE